MRKTFAATLTLSLSLPFSASAEDARHKWQGYTELEGKWGTERSLGEMGLFIPVWQDEDTLLAADIRQRIDDADSQEGNYGLSLRQLLAEQKVILGGYAYFDRRRTPNANVFHQATLGAEALWEDYEARLNVYIPESTEKTLSPASVSAVAVGGNIQVQSFTGATERALPGFDAELGAKFDLSEEWKLWLYGGGFYFDHSGYDTVAGPRGRLEISRGDLPMFGEGSRLTLGLEVQHDSVRGEQAFAMARIRVPFAAFGGKGQADNLTPLEQRMTSRIYRDVDIVSDERAPQLTETEAGYAELGDGVQTASYVIVRAGDDLGAKFTEAGTGNMIIADGTNGTIDALNAQMLQGQTLIGGGAQVNVTSASGKSATLTLPGTRGTINGTSDVYIDVPFMMADDTSVRHLDITGGHYSLYIDGVDNASVEDVRLDRGVAMSSSSASFKNVDIIIEDGWSYGIYSLNGSGDVLMENVTIENADYTAVWVQNTDAVMRNVTIRDSDDYGVVSFGGGELEMVDTTIQDTAGTAFWVGSSTLSGTGNVISGSAGTACFNNGGNSGSIGFDDILGSGPTTCP